MIEFTEKDKNTLTACIIFLVILVSGLFYLNRYFWRVKINAKSKELTVLVEENKKVQSEIREAKLILAQENQIPALKDKIDKIKKRLPDKPDARGFYLALVDILEATGVKYNFVLPDKTKIRTGYTEIPYKIELLCGYHELGEFISLIEENPDRIMRLNTLSVDFLKGRPTTHKINIQVSTFMFNKSS